MKELVGWMPGASVADPFMGSGTTLVAAKAIGKSAIGIRDRGTLLRDRGQKRLSQGVLEIGGCVLKRLTLCVLICGMKISSAQSPVSPLPLTNITALPSMFGGGSSFNQLGTPQYNFWLAGIVPISSSVGMYESTTTDLIPITQTDSATGRTVHTLQATLREGIHKTIPTPCNPSKNMLLIGGKRQAWRSPNPSVTGAERKRQSGRVIRS